MHTYTCRGRRVGWPGGPVAYRVSGGEVASSAPLDEMTPEQAQAAIVRLVAGGMDEKALAAGLDAATRAVCGHDLTEMIEAAPGGEHRAACPKCGNVFRFGKAEP